MAKKKKKKSIGQQAHTLTYEAKTALSDVLYQYDLVEVVENGGDPFIVVSQKSDGSLPVGAVGGVNPSMNKILDEQVSGPHAQVGKDWAQKAIERQRGQYQFDSVDDRATDVVNLFELGTSSPSPFTSFIRREYNRDLVGIKGLEIYDKMRKSDGVIKGTLRAIKTPVLSARWFCEPEDRTKPADVNAAEFVWDNLTDNMTLPWTQFLTESLLMAEFGYYMFEIVWEKKIYKGKERLMIKKLAPRHPMDVKIWHYDANGGPAGVTMYPSSLQPMDDIDIPIEYLLVFSFDKEAGNIEGISVLRSAYKHWYFKEQLYKIDAIQKERHSVGIPIIILPPGFSDNDKLAAENLGRNLRSNERAHIVLPPNWKLEFAELKGQPVDVIASIKLHDQSIRENIMASFLNADNTTKEQDQTLFLKATRFIADIVCETLNEYLVPKLVNVNFQRVGMPEIRARRIGEQEDWRTVSFAVRNLIGAGALVPDDVLEDYLRDLMDLPMRDEKTARIVQAPGNTNEIPVPPNETAPKDTPQGKQENTTPPAPPTPARVGMPRQGPPPTGKQRSNAGMDRSGG